MDNTVVFRIRELFLSSLIKDWESKRTTSDSIPLLRQKVMVFRIAKTFAIRGDEKNVAVAACWVDDTKSSLIQPNPTHLNEGFQAVSMKTEEWAGFKGVDSRLIK